MIQTFQAWLWMENTRFSRLRWHWQNPSNFIVFCSSCLMSRFILFNFFTKIDMEEGINVTVPKRPIIFQLFLYDITATAIKIYAKQWK